MREAISGFQYDKFANTTLVCKQCKEKNKYSKSNEGKPVGHNSNKQVEQLKNVNLVPDQQTLLTSDKSVTLSKQGQSSLRAIYYY